MVYRFAFDLIITLYSQQELVNSKQYFDMSWGHGGLKFLPQTFRVKSFNLPLPCVHALGVSSGYSKDFQRLDVG